MQVNNIGVANAVDWCFAHADDSDFNDPIDAAAPPTTATDDAPAGSQHAQQEGQEQTQGAQTSPGHELAEAANDKENVAPPVLSTSQDEQTQLNGVPIAGDGSPRQADSAGLQSPSVLGPVPTYSPPSLPHNEYAAAENGILDGSKAHEHVRPDLGDEDQQSRSKRRTETAGSAISAPGDSSTAVTEINPAYVPGTTASTTPPQDDWGAEIAQLLEMGFEESAVRQALTCSAGNVTAATQRLLCGPVPADGGDSKTRVGFSNTCVAESTCELGCETVKEHMAAIDGSQADGSGVLIGPINKGSSSGGPQPQPPTVPKPNQRRPKRSTGRPELNRAQKEQIQKCIQVLAQKSPGKQRPPWHQKVQQLLAMDDGEARVVEYQQTYSRVIAEMTEVMISLLRVANEDSEGQSEADEPAAAEAGVNTIVVDGSDNPTLQQFIDRVNDALRERDDAAGSAPEPETFHDLCVQLGIDEHENYLAMNQVDSKEQLQVLASHGLKESDCEEIGLSNQQRDAILRWAETPVCGLTVAVVSIERTALWHPIVSYTTNNLPRDLRQLLHESAEDGIADATGLSLSLSLSLSL
eukprot:COSAG03_NODE_485_length_7533_cov_37.012510_4_plen_581_part_00